MNQNNQPLISVLVAVYNAREYLNACVNSIVSQTYKNLEIILVNDGSTDESLAVCEEWAKKDSRIKVVDKENGGLASSRNTGLLHATGDLIGFVDGDDMIEPNMYEAMHRDMVEHQADIVMCNSKAFCTRDKLFESSYSYDSFEIERTELVNRMLTYEKIFNSSVWSKLYKKDIIGDTRFVDEIVLGEDYYFNGRLYNKVQKFYYDKRTFYHYRVRENSLSRSGITPYFFDKYKVAERFREIFKDSPYVKKQNIEQYHLNIIYEILYGLYIEKADKKTKDKWRNKYRKQYSLCKKQMYFNYRYKAKAFCLSNIPWLYTKVTKSISDRKAR